MLKKTFPLIFILLITAFLFKPVFKGLVPIPFDAMVGSYFPWLDYKWGYEVGVPVKNAALSDVFSQAFPWKALASDLIRKGQLPLWNPHSFSGYPLLANWQSAPFYPLSFLMVFLGSLKGFSALVLLQVPLSMLFMYLFLKKKGRSLPASLTGAVIFALSGFMMTYLEYGTTGQVFLWLPLSLYLIEQYFDKKKPLFLFLLSVSIYPILTAGFFQPAFFCLLIIYLYLIGKTFLSPHGQKLANLVKGSVFLFLGVLLGSLQTFPVLELFKLSIRNLDHNIVEYNYGLLPLRYLAAFLAPDLFGNPTTGNYSGVMVYQEASGYFSIISLPVIFWLVAIKKKDFTATFFSILFFVSLLLVFDNPISRLIFTLKIPFVSTGYASRWLLVTTLSASILVSYGLDLIKKPRELVKICFYAILALVVTIATTLAIKSVLDSDPHVIGNQDIIILISQLKVSLRNLVIPAGLAASVLAAAVLLPKKIFIWIFMGLVVFDLSRYFIKFTPFSRPDFSTAETPIFQYLKKNIGQYRIDRERGPLLPPNTWMYQKLSSPSGYDPLIYKSYATFYKLVNGSSAKDEGIINGPFTRYLELENYGSKLVDLAGVKYLLALKRDETGRFTKEAKKILHSIPQDKYIKVFEDGAVVVLENNTVLPRIKLYSKYVIESDQIKAQQLTADKFNFNNTIVLNKKPDNLLQSSAQDSIEIVNYSETMVEILVKTVSPQVLLLTDTFYPGWKAEVNGKRSEILTAFGIYRAVEVPSGESNIKFFYKSESFYNGIKVSLAALIASLLAFIILSIKRT
ncbi:YfhO family protein [Candidatus Woesebacteria bacterium]|nr:YfhO family protein [Candidatus Woesebacteria bacterium]